LVLALAALLPPCPVAAQTQAGGNKALMEDWVRKKQQARDHVYRELKRQKLLPKNASVSYEATVKQDPKHPDKVQVRVESLSIRENHEQNPAQAAPNDPIFGPRSPTGGAEGINDSPPAGQPVRGSITIIGGRLIGGASSTAQ
jgi:hypothetical protein